MAYRSRESNREERQNCVRPYAIRPSLNPSEPGVVSFRPYVSPPPGDNNGGQVPFAMGPYNNNNVINPYSNQLLYHTVLEAYSRLCRYFPQLINPLGSYNQNIGPSYNYGSIGGQEYNNNPNNCRCEMCPTHYNARLSTPQLYNPPQAPNVAMPPPRAVSDQNDPEIPLDLTSRNREVPRSAVSSNSPRENPENVNAVNPVHNRRNDNDRYPCVHNVPISTCNDCAPLYFNFLSRNNL